MFDVPIATRETQMTVEQAIINFSKIELTDKKAILAKKRRRQKDNYNS
jgi:hypothetical protein